MTPLEAITLLGEYDEGRITPITALNIDKIQAAIVAHGHRATDPVLLIDNTKELRDWVLNFYARRKVGPGDKYFWHAGFLHVAQVVYGFAKGYLACGGKLSAICGHSLGGAVTQILSPSMGLPGFAFASPQPLYFPDKDAPRPPNEKLVRNWCRTDDWVCKVPPARLGFDHVGEVNWLTPAKKHRGIDHYISLYMIQEFRVIYEPVVVAGPVVAA